MQVDYLIPEIMTSYDETVDDSSAREKFETRLKERLLKRMSEDLNQRFKSKYQ